MVRPWRPRCPPASSRPAPPTDHSAGARRARLHRLGPVVPFGPARGSARHRSALQPRPGTTRRESATSARPGSTSSRPRDRSPPSRGSQGCRGRIRDALSGGMPALIAGEGNPPSEPRGTAPSELHASRQNAVPTSPVTTAIACSRVSPEQYDRSPAAASASLTLTRAPGSPWTVSSTKPKRNSNPCPAAYKADARPAELLEHRRPHSGPGECVGPTAQRQ